MHAVDTNILVRFFVIDDDIEQTKRVAKLFKTDSIFISRTVLMETEWILRGVYKRDRLTINAGFSRLLDVATVEIESEFLIATALLWHKFGMDFADAIHLASSQHCEKFATFDIGIKKSAPAEQKARIYQL
jgi:predicted nucleic-acid-binding protein